MTKERLEEYRSNKDEIKELEYKLAHLGEGDSLVDNDVVFDYRTGYPQPQAVVGVDWEKHDRLKASYQNLLDRLRKDCAEVEEWINRISDGQMRRVFRMRYVEGLRMRTICEKTYMDRSTIYRKMDKIFQSCDTMQQMRHYNKK